MSEGAQTGSGSSWTPLLQVRDLEVRLRGSGKILLSLPCLDVGVGEIVGLAGPTGAGKTIATLAIMGLLPPSMRVSRGRILFRGADLCGRGDKEMSQLRGKDLALIFQSPSQALDPIRSCEIQLREPLARHARMNDADRRRWMCDALISVGFDDPDRVLRSRPNQLSGGERQRVLLAMAGLFRPSLVIADEPTSGLDPPLSRDFADALRTMSRLHGQAALLISHDEELLRQSVDRLATLDGEERSPPAARATPRTRIKRDAAHPFRQVLIEVEGLALSTGTGRRSAEPTAISFALHAGEALGVIGASGAGKTTLARILVGLLPSPEGSVRFPGHPQEPRLSEAQLIFQDPGASLNPALRILDAVAEPFLLCGQTGNDARTSAAELLAEVGLSDLLHERFPSELSGGQCQLTAIARALAAAPAILVADEPTASLDRQAAEQVVAVLRTLVETRRLALVLVSHDIGLIAEVCGEAMVIEHGALVERGPVDQLLQRPSHAETARLVAPFMRSRAT